MFGANGHTLLSKGKGLAPSTVLLTVGLMFLGAGAVRATPPTDPAERAKAVGQPAALTLHPAKISLAGPRDLQQLVISGKYADGSLRDLTPFAQFTTAKNGVVAVSPEGFVLPQANGATELLVTVGGQKASIPVTVSQFEQPKPVSFKHDLIPALSVGGCNSGACHGTPSGKNGFKLSLRGY